MSLGDTANSGLDIMGANGNLLDTIEGAAASIFNHDENQDQTVLVLTEITFRRDSWGIYRTAADQSLPMETRLVILRILERVLRNHMEFIPESSRMEVLKFLRSSLPKEKSPVIIDAMTSCLVEAIKALPVSEFQPFFTCITDLRLFCKFLEEFVEFYFVLNHPSIEDSVQIDIVEAFTEVAPDVISIVFRMCVDSKTPELFISVYSKCIQSVENELLFDMDMICYIVNNPCGDMIYEAFYSISCSSSIPSEVYRGLIDVMNTLVVESGNKPRTKSIVRFYGQFLERFERECTTIDTICQLMLECDITLSAPFWILVCRKYKTYGNEVYAPYLDSLAEIVVQISNPDDLLCAIPTESLASAIITCGVFTEPVLYSISRVGQTLSCEQQSQIGMYFISNCPLSLELLDALLSMPYGLSANEHLSWFTGSLMQFIDNDPERSLRVLHKFCELYPCDVSMFLTKLRTVPEDFVYLLFDGILTASKCDLTSELFSMSFSSIANMFKAYRVFAEHLEDSFSEHTLTLAKSNWSSYLDGFNGEQRAELMNMLVSSQISDGILEFFYSEVLPSLSVISIPEAWSLVVKVFLLVPDSRTTIAAVSSNGMLSLAEAYVNNCFGVLDYHPFLNIILNNIEQSLTLLKQLMDLLFAAHDESFRGDSIAGALVSLLSSSDPSDAIDALFIAMKFPFEPDTELLYQLYEVRDDYTEFYRIAMNFSEANQPLSVQCSKMSE